MKLRPLWMALRLELSYRSGDHGRRRKIDRALARSVRAVFRSLSARFRYLDQRALVRLRYYIQGISWLACAASLEQTRRIATGNAHRLFDTAPRN